MLWEAMACGTQIKPSKEHEKFAELAKIDHILEYQRSLGLRTNSGPTMVIDGHRLDLSVLIGYLQTNNASQLSSAVLVSALEDSDLLMRVCALQALCIKFPAMQKKTRYKPTSDPKSKQSQSEIFEWQNYIDKVKGNGVQENVIR